MIDVLQKLLAIVGVVLGVFFLGKNYGKKELKGKQNEETINDITKVRKIEGNNSKLTRDELIDKL